MDDILGSTASPTLVQIPGLMFISPVILGNSLLEPQ